MIIVGIDPGKKGGIAWIDQANGEIGTAVMPPGPDAFADFLDSLELTPYDHIFIEKCQARPGQGVSAMFNYGQHFGELIGIIVANQFKFTMVHPATWCKVMHQGVMLTGADSHAKSASKHKSTIAVRRLFPDIDLVPRGCKKASDGLVDALLIAEFGRRMLVHAGAVKTALSKPPAPAVIEAIFDDKVRKEKKAVAKKKKTRQKS